MVKKVFYFEGMIKLTAEELIEKVLFLIMINKWFMEGLLKKVFLF